MESPKVVINVSGTLKTIPVGGSMVFRGVRGTSLRQRACVLGELGMKFHVNKIEDGFLVTRES